MGGFGNCGSDVASPFRDNQSSSSIIQSPSKVITLDSCARIHFHPTLLSKEIPRNCNFAANPCRSENAKSMGVGGDSLD